jgi:hypothetical protein
VYPKAYIDIQFLVQKIVDVAVFVVEYRPELEERRDNIEMGVHIKMIDHDLCRLIDEDQQECPPYNLSGFHNLFCF